MTIKYFVKQKLFSELLTNLEYGLFVLDDQMRYVYVNDAFVTTVNTKREDIIGNTIGIHEQKDIPIETKIVIDEILNNLLLKKFHHGTTTISFNQLERVQVNVKIYGMTAAGEIYYVGVLDEGNSNKLDMRPIERELQHFDVVTQLPLKQYFMVQLSDLLLDTIDEVAVVRIHIDRFSMLKSNYSEESMNQLLVEFVQRIYDFNFKELISFSRFSDDSFAIIFELNRVMAAREYLDKILQLTEKPYIIGDNTVYLHYSIGVSTYPIDGGQADVLLDNAEKALHYAKEKGGDDVYWYDEKQQQVSAEKLQLENDIRNALQNNEFISVYQPKVDLDTLQIVGFEALVRWNHPREGLLSPASFLEEIIEYKLTFELFCYMAEQVVKHLYIWQLREMKQTLSINADSYDFLHPEFITFMTKLLIKYPVAAGSLHVEVTETSLMQQYDVDVLAQFKKLKELGVSIALDDFGTGYASISYLRHYPFDYIKIDKSFIEDLEKNDKQLLIVRAIIDLASALNFYTVAEGIETALHYDITADMGCVHGQGYLFGKPMTYTEATKLIASSSGSTLTVIPNAKQILAEVDEINQAEAKKSTKKTAKARQSRANRAKVASSLDKQKQQKKQEDVLNEKLHTQDMPTVAIVKEILTSDVNEELLKSENKPQEIKINQTVNDSLIAADTVKVPVVDALNDKEHEKSTINSAQMNNLGILKDSIVKEGSVSRLIETTSQKEQLSTAKNNDTVRISTAINDDHSEKPLDTKTILNVNYFQKNKSKNENSNNQKHNFQISKPKKSDIPEVLTAEKIQSLNDKFDEIMTHIPISKNDND